MVAIVGTARDTAVILLLETAGVVVVPQILVALKRPRPTTCHIFTKLPHEKPMYSG